MDYTYKTLGDSFDKELWDFLGNYKNKKIEAIDVFYECLDAQFLEDVRIDIKDPWVVISFDKKDTILATYVICYKSIWGFTTPLHYKFYLNDKEFSYKELYFPEDLEGEELISRFIKNNKNDIKEKNTYKIEIINNINLNYLRQIKIFLFEKDYISDIEDFFINK